MKPTATKPLERTQPQSPPPGPAQPLAAVIFDLDGVITHTAELHALAWQRMFNAFLDEEFPTQPPFTRDADYREYVDGKPRLDGVRSFLAARGIELADGNADDPPEVATVHGLAARKNELFRELVAARGVQVFEDATSLLEVLGNYGVAAAVVSSSRNCSLLLDKAGLAGRFSAQVDGVERERRGLRGKPAPEMFLEAARELGVAPASAAVLEDARAGVEAGRAGGFGLVVGVDRDGTKDSAEGLFAHGADVVLTDLRKLEATLKEPARRRQFASLAEANAAEGDATEALPWQERTPVLFLDYDGTLSPIVRDPAAAYPLDGMRDALEAAAAAGLHSFVISGRDTETVRTFLGLERLVYAGSHGMQISGPGGLEFEEPAAHTVVPALDAVQARLSEALASVAGAALERKRFAVAVHYRNLVEPHMLERVKQEVEHALAAFQGTLRLGHGKKVFEIRPELEWHKGHAVMWLLERFGLTSPEYVPLYLGDDLTDEDAFATLVHARAGYGILVGDHGELTAAHYRLPNVEAVRDFLHRLAQNQGQQPPQR